jgi:predicted ATP-binding protein involved in virulence
MRLEKVTIRNYRCFSNYEIEFTQKVNVLIGKNGSGKTAIINAMRHGLSFVFAKNTPSGNDQPLAASADGLTVESPTAMDAFYDETMQDNRYPIAIQCKAVLREIALPEWEIYKESAGGRVFPTKYKEAHQAFEKQHYLPVLAIYSDSYPHIESSLSKYAERILGSGHKIPKNFGYYQWCAESACTEVWEQRFINIWMERNNKRQALENYTGNVENVEPLTHKVAEAKILSELLTLEKEREFITNLLVKFSQPVSSDSYLDQFIIKGLEVSTRLQNNYLNVRFKGGNSMLFQNLPAGYKRLFSIVLDIAYRACILQSAPTADAISGIVIIDEIDLHLHPSLEQEVIQRFQKTFPNIQFIVSTHSALVIANLKANNGLNSIIRLDYTDKEYRNQKLPNIFGIGYEASLSDFMGTPPRDSNVKYLAEAYIRLDKRQEHLQAQRIRTELMEYVGNKQVDEIIESFK